MRIKAVHVSASEGFTVRLDLDCGHIVRGNLPPLEPGDLYACPECDTAPVSEQRKLPADVLDYLADEYAAEMRAKGVVIDNQALGMIKRAAGIQWVWFKAMRKAIEVGYT